MINIENKKDELRQSYKREINSKKNKKFKKNDLSEEEESKSNAGSEISFSISKPSDIDSLCDKVSNKSKDDDLKFTFESTLKTAENDLMKDIDDELKIMTDKLTGFDKDIKLMSSNYYKSLTESLIANKNQNPQSMDKTIKGMTNFGSMSEAIDEQTIRLKNDLSGEPVLLGADMTEITDIKFSKQSSLQNKEKLVYKKTLSLNYSKEKENSSKKEMISSSSRNKISLKNMESESKIEDQKD